MLTLGDLPQPHAVCVDHLVPQHEVLGATEGRGGNCEHRTRLGSTGHQVSQVTSRHVRSRQVMSRQVTSGHVMSRQVTSGHVRSREVT